MPDRAGRIPRQASPGPWRCMSTLLRRSIHRSIGLSGVHRLSDTGPVGQLLSNVLAMVSEFGSDLIQLRTREVMNVAKAKGSLRAKQPTLNHRQVRSEFVIDQWPRLADGTIGNACGQRALFGPGRARHAADMRLHQSRGSASSSRKVPMSWDERPDVT